MNFWGFMGLLFVWISGSNYEGNLSSTFVCDVITACVFFIASVFRWISWVIGTRMGDDDYYD
jgi:hypothetical protein